LQRLNRAHRLFEALHASADLLDIAGRLDGLEDTYLRVMQQWAESIESKDLYTHGHCERVADYGCMLAAAVGFSGRELTWFRMGGFLHDVGKTAVPAEVLNKPGKLDDNEWKIMQSHTTVGDDIVAELNFPWDIRPLVRSHHERWDGTGYPDRLAGEQIPFPARILCIADVYDALTTARSYRPALSQDEALRIMDKDAGRIFDPALYAVFRKLVAPELPVAA
jgi:putative nucleotidyltransferase with HDIG domain